MSDGGDGRREAAAKALARAFRAGNRSALARAISIVERGGGASEPLLAELLKTPPAARRFGITGPPGAGKSSLASGLVQAFRERGEEVAVVAVDPTSPFSGGALLGDRIRMGDHALDSGVFIRSMATRGSLGGLAGNTRQVVELLDAFGFPNIIVETVGVGQTELEISSAADTVAVVLVPESGDGVQAMKAGLMEIADIFVVNKSDRIGADRLVREIRQALALRSGGAPMGDAGHHGAIAAAQAHAASPGEENGVWGTPVLKTSAGRGEGIQEFVAALLKHRAHLIESGEMRTRRRERAIQRIRDAVEAGARRRAREALGSFPALGARAAEVAEGRATPESVAREALRLL